MTQEISVVRQFAYIHRREISLSTKQDNKWNIRGTLFNSQPHFPTKNPSYTLVGFTNKLEYKTKILTQNLNLSLRETTREALLIALSFCFGMIGCVQ